MAGVGQHEASGGETKDSDGHIGQIVRVRSPTGSPSPCRETSGGYTPQHACVIKKASVTTAADSERRVTVQVIRKNRISFCWTVLDIGEVCNSQMELAVVS